MSSHLQWELIKKSSSFLVRDKKTGVTFSKEPQNIRKRNTFKDNGLIHKKTVGIFPGKGNKGVVLVYKKKNERKPATMYARVNLPNKDPRKVYRSIRKTLGNKQYRRDLIEPAVRKASVILRRQLKPRKRFLKAAKDQTAKK